LTYREAREYIFSKLPMYQRIGEAAYKKDLTNIRALCEVCGNPELSLKTIHIAGTNGKGTTTHLIAAALQASGYKTGVYTSPHYKDYIPQKTITAFISKYKADLERIQPSFFEMTVALAFCYFRDEKVDIAVIETGLGGRLDSTNIITPLISVITNISFDHVAMLGNTIPAIAREKAGIIKPGIPVVVGEYQAETLPVFQQTALETGSKVYLAPDHVQVLCPSGHPDEGFTVHLDDKLWLPQTSLDVRGPYQLKNLTTACMALHLISTQFPLKMEAIAEFLPSFSAATNYMGRWQILAKNPMILCDSAHNEGGLKVVIKTILEIPHQKLHIVAGFVNDKDITDILNIFPKEAQYYFAKARIPRGLDAKSLLANATAIGLHGKAYSSVKHALRAAQKSASAEDLIFVGGSIFVVAEVL